MFIVKMIDRINSLIIDHAEVKLEIVVSLLGLETDNKLSFKVLFYLQFLKNTKYVRTALNHF